MHLVPAAEAQGFLALAAAKRYIARNSRNR
jgi:hypothetical protein